MRWTWNKLEWSPREKALCRVVLALLAVAVFGPALGQSPHQHDFADMRAWAGLPCAIDVLSNAAFALWGALGLAALHAARRTTSTTTTCAPSVGQHALSAVFFVGLVLTAAASSWYHHRPDDAGLAIDRLGMVVAFAGLMGLAAAQRVSARAGWLVGGAVLLLGPLSVAVWAATGNVLPWAVVQFGGMALLLGMARLTPHTGAWAVRWGWVIAVYGLAKLLELADHDIYAWTSQVVSGHSLKHIVASFAAWPVIAALHNQGRITRLQRLLRAYKTDKNRSPA